MTTTVTITGTGVPHLSPGRAGPGVLVRHGDVALQFDAGRATALRLTRPCTCPPGLPVCVCGHGSSPFVRHPAKAITPGEEERQRNPRSRSARLRGLKRTNRDA